MNKFICRICKGTEYQEDWTDEIPDKITQDRDNSIHVDIAQFLIGYSCMKCGIMFSNPDLFSEKSNTNEPTTHHNNPTGKVD